MRERRKTKYGGDDQADDNGGDGRCWKALLVGLYYYWQRNRCILNMTTKLTKSQFWWLQWRELFWNANDDNGNDKAESVDNIGDDSVDDGVGDGVDEGGDDDEEDKEDDNIQYPAPCLAHNGMCGR